MQNEKSFILKYFEDITLSPGKCVERFSQCFLHLIDSTDINCENNG